MKPLICLLAKGVLVDSQENSVSIFSILEGIEPAGFPFLIQDSAAFVLWARDDEEPTIVDLTIRLRNNEKELIAAPVRVDFQEKRTSRLVANFRGLRIEDPGVLSVSYEQSGTELARYEMIVSPVTGTAADSVPVV
jgi:hypothetical protein